MECPKKLLSEGIIRDVEPEAMSRLLNGATLNAALWIAASEQPLAELEIAKLAFISLANDLLKNAE